MYSHVVRHAYTFNCFDIFLKTSGPISTKFGMKEPWSNAFQVCSYPMPRSPVGYGVEHIDTKSSHMLPPITNVYVLCRNTESGYPKYIQWHCYGQSAVPLLLWQLYCYLVNNIYLNKCFAITQYYFYVLGNYSIIVQLWNMGVSVLWTSNSEQNNNFYTTNFICSENTFFATPIYTICVLFLLSVHKVWTILY